MMAGIRISFILYTGIVHVGGHNCYIIHICTDCCSLSIKSVSNTTFGAKHQPPMTKINMSQNRFSNQVIYDQGCAPVGELRDIKKAEFNEFKKEFLTF